jgi:hypothetical protein
MEKNRNQLNKLDAWLDAHPRLFWMFVAGVVCFVSVAFIPGLAPEGCRTWGTLFTCSSLPPFWSIANLRSGVLYLALIFGGPAVLKWLWRSVKASPAPR